MSHKVLVVDDSALMRKVLRQVLSDAGFQVESARSGREGVEMALAFEPDVVTLDINMPEMDGLTALSLLMAARPTPVIMVSSLTTANAMPTLEALALGAVDYVAKPGGTISLNMELVADDLVRKVRAASTARIRSGRGRPPRPAARPAVRPARVMAPPPVSPAAGRPEGLVLIGVSTGGPRTLEDILPQLPANFPWPVLVCQHMPAQFTTAFAQRMDQICALDVQECDGPTPLRSGQVLIAQGGFDMVVAERLGRLVAIPVPEAAGEPWHPCVDVLVDSALRHMPAQQMIGVLLTGMGFDGAASMTRLHQQGGRTIAESAETAVVFGMPHELIQRGGADCVLPSPQVSDQLRHWVRPH
ncbi:MAG: chemotaxis-specific protein-glutamate methyltransferase CheB [Burkholderiales bacterium]|nr:MAG: chemotaxis-specific protein-glutamate methyltransferase CheB [Burkholderiales bacterium]